MQRGKLILILLAALSFSAFYAYREHLKIRILAAQLEAQRQESDALAGRVNRQPVSSTAESAANRFLSRIATVVPPISPIEFGSMDDVQDLQDIQRVFVPTLLELGLSGEQVAQVRSLMLRRRQSARDAKDIARERKWSTAAVVIQAIREAEAKYDPQIRAVVGDEKFEQMNAMLVDESYFRRVQSGIATDAELFGAPLSADQKLTLTKVMAGVLNQAVHPQAAVDPVTGLTPSDQQILDRANGALSDAQRGVLRRYLARQHVGSAGFW